MAVTDTTSRVDIGRELLAAAVDALVSSDQWTAWLESRARFRDYSLGNTMLIAYQRPDATRVAGYKAWQSLGRQVRTGEKGLAIPAPMVRKVESATGEKSKARDDSGRVIVRFRTVYVFDVSQTEGDDLPEGPCRRLEGDSGLTGAADALAGHAFAEGLEIARESIAGNANGYIARSERRIVIDVALERDQALKTLVHELAHWHDLGPAEAPGLDRDAAEIVAESVAFIVGQAIGLDTSDYSAGYVAVWAGADSSRLHTLAERIDRAARPILAAVDEVPR